LSIGDISEHHPGDKRQKALERLFSIYPSDVGNEAAREFFQAAQNNLTVIQKRAMAGEPIRVWYSNQPDDMCGLYWFMEQLRQWNALDGELSLVKLPEWELDDENTIIHRSGWGELSPEEWYKYLDSQILVSPVLKSSFAAHWRELQHENAPLRAVLNGQLTSVSENLYDSFIFREIEAESDEFQEAKVIGRVLGKYQLGIGDAWIALRIDEMIGAGNLEALSTASDDSPVYHRKLRKSVRVREIKPADYSALEDFLYHAIFIPEGEALPPRDIIFEPEIYVYIKDYGAESDCGVVAEADGRIVGAAWARIIPAYGHIDDNTPELAISVLPGYRGQNIGTAMMEKLFELLRERGYRRTSLSVQQNNRAVRFYERLGYKITEETLDHAGHEDYSMIKEL
jgi:ribosomal protein S18 acetylase RimI-like enzyme